jgi:hypothetical protein
MMTTLRLLSLVLAAYMAVREAAHALPQPVGIPNEGLVMFDENPFNGSPRGFYRYDLETEQLSLITEVPMTADRLSGFAWHPVERRVYAGSEGGRLYTIELLTGEVNLVGQAPISAQFPFIRGLTFQPGTNELFAMGLGPRLYHIDTNTAASTLLGTVPELDGGLAFTPAGTLYGWTPVARLMEIDPVTLDTEIISSSPFGIVSNLTSGPDGTLYGSGWQQGGIVEIDPATGTGELIAQYNEHVNGVIGVFYYVIPEPASAIMFVGAFCFILGARRGRP